MIAEILERIFNEKKLIGLKTNMIENDESIIGFLTDVSEISIKINEIDEYGFFIGNTIIEINDIVSIEMDDRYQMRLKFIHDNYNQLRPNDRITVWQEGYKLIPYFNEILSNKHLTTFYLGNDNYVTGFLSKINDTQIEINNIGGEGDEDGVSYHLIQNLTGLRFNGLEEQKIKLLYDNRKLFQ